MFEKAMCRSEVAIIPMMIRYDLEKFSWYVI